ncbi:MAG: hypothetical protein LAO78_27580 [Acidobacteriia bacterium]|nr:hypothetical protein [Terriglobia bacterium]
MPETRLQSAQEVLEEIARDRGSKVSSCKEFDPNVCTFTQDQRNRAVLVASSGQPFLRKTAFKVRDLRARLLANDSFLRIMLFLDLDVEPIALNRPDKIQLLRHANEIVLGGRSYPVFTRSGSLPGRSSGMLNHADFLRLLQIANLGAEESIHLYRNGLAIYLFSPAADRAGQIIEAATSFLSHMPSAPRETDLSGLPANLSPLLPLIRSWGATDDTEREERRQGVPRPALQAMVEQVKPYLPAINSYLQQFGKTPLTEAAIALGALAEFVVETELYLKNADL